jgi:ribosomal 30S subunit maturation factor RimM
VNPGNDVLVVRRGGRERLIPMIDRVIGSVDLERGRITIHPIDGLLD